MPRVLIAIGANMDSPREKVEKALEEIQVLGRNFKCSRLYNTPPVSSIEQNNFLNAVCAFETDLGVEELFHKLEAIEVSLGKKPKSKEEPRPIDLDLLFYGKSRLQTSKLMIPHPRWQERLFVLLPLSDLVDRVEVGDKEWQVKELIDQFSDEEIIKYKVVA